MTRKRTLTAAAARYTARRLRTAQPTSGGWQEQAWGYWDTVPEVRFAGTWIANAMGRARLYAAYRTDTGDLDEAPADHPATELVNGIAGGLSGQAQLLTAFGPHLVVAGEAWVVVRPYPDDDRSPAPADWRVLSTQEVRQQGSKMVVEIDGEDVDVPGADDDSPLAADAPVAMRVWQPHPRRYLEADSPVRSAMQLLEELQLLNGAVGAIARSRLTGRGVLLVPKGVRFPTKPGSGDSEDDIIDLFMEVAETAYREPESAAATVPIILEVPPDSIDKIQRVTFESDFDQIAIQLREEAIRRFATGLEVPAETLLGMGKVNHWGQWALQEEAIRLGVQPRLDTVTSAFTVQYMQPLLEAEGVDDWHRWAIAADTAPLRVRGNRAETAIRVYEVGAISAAALRRETGFDETDAPTQEEQQQREEDPGEPVDVDGERTTGLPVDETRAEPTEPTAGQNSEPPRTASAAPTPEHGPSVEEASR